MTMSNNIYLVQKLKNSLFKDFWKNITSFKMLQTWQVKTSNLFGPRFIHQIQNLNFFRTSPYHIGHKKASKTYFFHEFLEY